MLTPLAWHRPWLIARQAATIDRLSGGRFTLAVGLGAPPDEGLWFSGDEPDRHTRAAMLDEALAILQGLWSGEPFAFAGEHFSLHEVTFLPPPVQRPRIPVWAVGAWPRDPDAWPRRRSMRRAIRFDGLLPNVFDHDGQPVYEATEEESLADLRAMRDWVERERTPRPTSGDAEKPYDIVIEREIAPLAPAAGRAAAAR